ncbi:MAG: hypothetical protein RIQ55_245 [Pseudomonadota bacterium]
MEVQSGFDWSDRYLLGQPQMDDTHREFVTRVNALLTVPDDQLAEALAAFEQHAVAHFAQENEWMSQDGFPARDCHVDEHDKVLASVSEVREQLAAGDVAIVRELAHALMSWFPEHADYMDAALAMWLVKKEHGGAPVVVRRNMVQE